MPGGLEIIAGTPRAVQTECLPITHQVRRSTSRLSPGSKDLARTRRLLSPIAGRRIDLRIAQLHLRAGDTTTEDSTDRWAYQSSASRMCTNPPRATVASLEHQIEQRLHEAAQRHGDDVLHPMLPSESSDSAGVDRAPAVHRRGRVSTKTPYFSMNLSIINAKIRPAISPVCASTRTTASVSPRSASFSQSRNRVRRSSASGSSFPV